MSPNDASPSGPPTVAAPEDLSVRAWGQLARTSGRLHRLVGRVLSRHGLTSPQFDLLTVLEAEDGCTLPDLATRLYLSKAVATVVVNNLEVSRLVERRSDYRDRRIRRIHLTPLARERLAAIRPDQQAALRTAWAGLTGKDLATLCRLLARVDSGLSDE